MRRIPKSGLVRFQGGRSQPIVTDPNEFNTPFVNSGKNGSGMMSVPFTLSMLTIPGSAASALSPVGGARTAACAIQSKRRISYCRFLVLEARPVSSW